VLAAVTPLSPEPVLPDCHWPPDTCREDRARVERGQSWEKARNPQLRPPSPFALLSFADTRLDGCLLHQSKGALCHGHLSSSDSNTLHIAGAQ
jgi:hypothetical protein